MYLIWFGIEEQFLLCGLQGQSLPSFYALKDAPVCALYFKLFWTQTNIHQNSPECGKFRRCQQLHLEQVFTMIKK